MKFKKFIDLYRSIIESKQTFNVDEQWYELSGKMDDDSKLSKRGKADDELVDEINEQIAIDEVWKNISFELDLDDVWTGINESLSKEEKKNNRWLWWVSSAAAVIIVFAFIWFNSPSNNNIQNDLFSENEVDYEELFEKEELTSDSLDIELIIKQYISRQSEIVYPSVTLNRSSELNTYQVLKSNSSFKNDDTLIKASMLDFNYKPLKLNEPILADLKIEPLKVEEKEKRNISIPEINLDNWNIGLTATAKNTMMMNQKTIEGFKPDELTSSKVKFVPDFAIHIGYDNGNRLSYDMSYFYNSTFTQSYQEYVFGKYTNHDIELAYSTFEFKTNYRHMSSLTPYKNVSRKTIAGLYYARLKTASQSYLTENIDLSSIFNKNDVGLVLGQEFESDFNKFSVNLGAYVKYGLSDVNKHESDVIGGFTNTHNISAEIRLGVQFNL